MSNDRELISDLAADSYNNQDWAKTDPAIAWHLIERHADNWTDAGLMMERWARAWVAANPVAGGES